MKKNKENHIKKLLLFILSTVFFSFLIFITKDYFFASKQERELEIEYLEKSHFHNHNDDHDHGHDLLSDAELKKKLRSALTQNPSEYNSAAKIEFSYVPETFQLKVGDYVNIADDFFSSVKMQALFFGFQMFLHEEKIDVRGKMKNGAVLMYGVTDLEKEEFLSVSIHEFAHFVDLYFLEKKVFSDTSDIFYDISWEKTKVILAGQKQGDFVSGYAMTNKYEDFAESFTYYILHNAEFLEKTKQSPILKKKYDFFSEYLFQEEEFFGSDFHPLQLSKSYYRDITKIPFSLKNLLQYIKK